MLLRTRGKLTFAFQRMINKWRDLHPLNGAGKKEKKGCVVV
jgi:hypothetical protein